MTGAAKGCSHLKIHGIALEEKIINFADICIINKKWHSPAGKF
jgi:hypothetical protein